MPLSQVVLAAIFDLLINTNDRHQKNVLVSRDGSITLIDNENVLNGAPLPGRLKDCACMPHSRMCGWTPATRHLRRNPGAGTMAACIVVCRSVTTGDPLLLLHPASFIPQVMLVCLATTSHLSSSPPPTST